MRSKYRNRKIGGYDSRKEMNRALDLELMQTIGEISDLQRQVKFEIVPKQAGERAVTYVADFAYTVVATGERVVEDVKSEMTRKLPAYVIKRKLMLFRHGIRIREV